MWFNRTGCEMKIVDEEIYWLPGLAGPIGWIHLLSFDYGIRQFVIIQDGTLGRVYLNEITTGHLEEVDDDILFEEICQFLREEGYTEFVRGK